jgi:hypothetical protein
MLGSVNAYRTSPQPLAKLAPAAPRWRIAWAWCRGVFRRIDRAQQRRALAIFAWPWSERQDLTLTDHAQVSVESALQCAERRRRIERLRTAPFPCPPARSEQ